MGIFDPILAEFGAPAFAGAFLVMLFAAFTKGAVGFALPMITVSGIGSIMSAELAVAALILPALVTNTWQSLRNGFGQARASFVKYWRINIVLLVMIYFCAQLIMVIPDNALFIILGAGVTVFGGLQLLGWRMPVAARWRSLQEIAVGLLSGFFGGLAGVWGPPITLYLIARETPKAEQVRTLGIAFLIGSIVLLVAHRQSGLLDATTTPFSAALVIPAVFGLWLGFKLQDRLDQKRFLRITLVVLILAGLNLLRRGVMG